MYLFFFALFHPQSVLNHSFSKQCIKPHFVCLAHRPLLGDRCHLKNYHLPKNLQGFLFMDHKLSNSVFPHLEPKDENNRHLSNWRSSRLYLKEARKKIRCVIRISEVCVRFVTLSSSWWSPLLLICTTWLFHSDSGCSVWWKLTCCNLRGTERTLQLKPGLFTKQVKVL